MKKGLLSSVVVKNFLFAIFEVRRVHKVSSTSVVTEEMLHFSTSARVADFAVI